MKSRIDFQTIANFSLSIIETLLADWLPGGHNVAGEYVVRNPTRADSTPGSFKIKIKTGEWADFAMAGDSRHRGGDLISLYAYIHGCNQGKAALEIGERYGISTGTPANPTPPAKPADDWDRVDPVPDDAPAHPVCRTLKINDTWQSYKIDYWWPYRNTLGQLRGYIVRYETPERKQTPPLTLWRNKTTGALKWRWKQISNPRPLHHLDKLAHSPNAQVILVEGEKCSEALQGIIESADVGDQLVATTWIGGVESVRKTDWTPLHGRKIVLWPDFDLKTDKDTGELLPVDQQPGYQAMATIAGILSGRTELKFVQPVPGKTDGWDVADAILNDKLGFTEIVAFIQANLAEPPDPKNSATEKPDEDPPLPDEPPPSGDDIPPITYADDTDSISDAPFKCLGHDGEFDYYLPAGTKRITWVRRENYGSGSMRKLADNTYWERRYPSKKGPRWSDAANDMLRASERAGIYDPYRLRGRGAWYDKGRAVLHLGDRLVVDGKETAIHEFSSRYMYEAGSPLDCDIMSPLGLQDANNLRQLLDMLSWEKPIYSVYTAGWIVLATICGALRFRPHLWITGRSGSGKTTIIEEIIGACLGDIALSVQGKTTESGLRQKLRNDSRPVIFDEIDPDTPAGFSRVQEVLALSRSASSDTYAVMLKGIHNGKAQEITIRSMFLLSSVNVYILQKSDESRIEVVTIRERLDPGGKLFTAIKDKKRSFMTKEWCDRFFSRCVKMVPTIRHNAEVFAQEISDKLGRRRIGDKIGHLLAGAYALSSDGKITNQKAREWIASQDLEDSRESPESTDERKCLDAIMTSKIRVSVKDPEVSIYELLERHNKNAHSGATAQVAAFNSDLDIPEDTILRRHGIHLDVDEALIYISDSHPEIKKMLSDTSYSINWGRTLRRIPETIVKQSQRFMGTRTRATGIPWDIVFGGD